MMTQNDFMKLKKLTEEKLAFSEDNIQGKIASIPLLYDTYMKAFVRENKLLNELKLDKDVLYADLYKYFKYDADHRWDTKNEIESQMYSDVKYQSKVKQINEQQEIVTFLELTLENIKTLSFSLKNYIDWRKFQEAVI